MTFHASLSLITFSAFVTLPTLNHFVSPFNIFSHCVSLMRFPSIIPVVTRYPSFSLFITWPNKVACHLRILLVSFDLFAVYDIHSILQRNHISVVSNFFCTCFEICPGLASIHQNGFHIEIQTLLLV